MLKERIKICNIEVYGNLDCKIKSLVEYLNISDEVASVRNLNVEEVSNRRKITENLWRVQRQKDNLVFQKSRVRWLREGDSYSSFFHSCVKFRRRRNNILALLAGNIWVEGVDSIKDVVKKYFCRLFASQPWQRPVLDGLPFNCLSEAEKLALVEEFSLDEVKDAVWNWDGDKSPGPDGFNFSFFNKFWPSICDEVKALVDEFHSNSTLSKGICSSFVTLIPKRENPQNFFRF